ncbi:DUF3152 domain-containing protein [Streptomyces sp. NPDC053755]|uniref:DUF3152 domain-containing protein n=1 Tax=Streptomyces sp. NPDC053755 TaxID=3155815 RepID=UPI003426E214
MGRHSRRGPAPAPAADTARRESAGQGQGQEQGQGPGRRRRSPDEDASGRNASGQGGYAQDAHGRETYGQEPYVQGGFARREGNGQGSYGGAAPQGREGYGRTATAYGQALWDTPAHGTPAHAAPADAPVRGGHPGHAEGASPSERYGDWQGVPRTAPQPPGSQAPFIPAPRRGTDADATAGTPADLPADEPAEDRAGTPAARNGGKGRTLTGIAAAAVTTVLAVVVAGQVAESEAGGPLAHAADGPADRAVEDGAASRSDNRIVPAEPAPAAPAVPVVQPTYEQLMTRQFPIDPKLRGSGDFEAVPGFDKAPGKGRKVRYRVDVEKGLGLDAKLFARAVQTTLNDERSWAGKGAMSFERISSGEPEFVITLASPGTTGTWCAKSGLDTTVDNVSCDSASTSRVMINAFRWAQGAETFGPKAMLAYRQMLINHEVGHRLGHDHVSCRTPGALAPVMQQQTKSLDVDGIRCRPNPWVNPTG